MTSLELLQEIDAWLSFNNSPSKEQISELRNDIKKHISEQLNILRVSNSVCPNCGAKGHRTTLTNNSYACKKCKTWWANGC
jgi:predicted Zn-ribbon and HTH transcriptional regulator